MPPFEVGEHVILVKTFRCDGDGDDFDDRIDAEIRATGNLTGLVIGVERDNKARVRWEGTARPYVTNNDCLALEVSLEEEEAAIASILQVALKPEEA